MTKDRVLISLTVLFFILGVVCILYVLFGQLNLRKQISDAGKTECVDRTLSKVMNENLMKGVLDKGQIYRVLSGYYACNPIKIDDMVWYRFSKSIEPVVRIVRGLPDDKFQVYKDNKNEKVWYVKINDRDVEFDGEKYAINTNSIPPLKTYEIQHKGILPKDKFILFTKVSPGLSDSSNLGLTSKNEIVGKVELVSN